MIYVYNIWITNTLSKLFLLIKQNSHNNSLPLAEDVGGEADADAAPATATDGAKDPEPATAASADAEEDSEDFALLGALFFKIPNPQWYLAECVLITYELIFWKIAYVLILTHENVFNLNMLLLTI